MGGEHSHLCGKLGSTGKLFFGGGREAELKWEGAKDKLEPCHNSEGHLPAYCFLKFSVPSHPILLLFGECQCRVTVSSVTGLDRSDAAGGKVSVAQMDQERDFMSNSVAEPT